MEARARRLAWPIAAVSVSLTAVGLLLVGLTIDRPAPTFWGFRGFNAIIGIETATLGALLLSRRPGNVIGWLFAVVGLANAVQLIATEYVVAAAAGGLPGGTWAAWVNAWVWVPIVVIMAGVVPLLFPDGRLLSPRWRVVLALLVVGGVLATVALASYEVAGPSSVVPYPFESPLSPPVGEALWRTGFVAILIGAVAAIGSLWIRWRRAVGVEREQLKWLAWSGGLVAITLPFAALPYVITQAIVIAAMSTVPIAVGIAILRYRLYEIDTVISHTLVYGLLTAILAGLFAGLQRLLQGTFVSVTGNESDAAWAITALVLAALFAPLRSTLERLVQGRMPVSAPAETGATASAPPDARQDGERGVDAEPLVAMSAADLEALIRRIVRDELAAEDRQPTT